MLTINGRSLGGEKPQAANDGSGSAVERALALALA